MANQTTEILHATTLTQYLWQTMMSKQWKLSWKAVNHMPHHSLNHSLTQLII